MGVDALIDGFLAEQPGPIPWYIPEGGRGRFLPRDLFLGKGGNPLEVAVATTDTQPNVSDVRQLWKRRHGGRASPLLLVVLYQDGSEDRVAVCGPIGDDPPVQRGLDIGMVERLAEASLAEPSRNAAIRFLQTVLPETEAGLPGLRNAGMFATHELEGSVPGRPDWAAMTEWGRKIMSERGQHLLMALGFRVDPLDVATSVLYLKDEGTRTAVAVLLDEDETPDGSSPRFNNTSPATYALKKADDEQLPYVVITRGSQIRVYAATKHTGVGRKGRAETFVEANLALLPDDRAGYLPLLFGAPALAPDGTFQQILESSKDYATDLSVRLRDRVYEEVVPQLARVVAARYQPSSDEISEEELASLYEQAMTILFRLLFVAYAEDKRVLPYAENGRYKLNALKTLARQFADALNEDGLAFDDQAEDLWSQVRSLWRAVDQGHTEWDVPAYDGGLFSSDADVNPIGARLAELRLGNAEIGPALGALLVDQTEDGGFGPVDFRSLSVREFGTIYEGLLESKLSVAPFDLALHADGTYVPAQEGDNVEVAEGEIYLQHRSGARKSTGTYFTKPFAVEHLLEHALEPALDEHLQRLRSLVESREDTKAAEAFFDFRCADIAMGSGHFLVAAVDHIEVRLSSFLAEHPIAGVVNELERLRGAAHERLGDLADSAEIEQSSLLRRQAARRCIYGVDLNPIAVELARLAMWIHTFVPGLPLSFLDHNLVCGNSLTGIGSLDEALDVLVPDTGRSGTPSMLLDQIEEWLGRAKDDLHRLARLSDATASEIKEARAAHQDARAAVKPAENLFDLLVAVRAGDIPRFEDVSDELVNVHPKLDDAKRLAVQVQALHFPVVFPEVFLRERSGFDSILGNPPWDKVRFEAQQFWVTRFPGLNALSANERDRAIGEFRSSRPDHARAENRERSDRERLQTYFKASYQHQGRGHYDYAKLFVERAVSVGREGGYLGYVLPRQALVLGGWATLRELTIDNSRLTVLQARNKGGWLFEQVHHSYMIVLIAREHRASEELLVWPAVTSEKALRSVAVEQAVRLSRKELSELSDTLVIPWFDGPEAIGVFDSLRGSTRLSEKEGWIQAAADARWDFSGSGRHRELASGQEAADAWRVLMSRHVLPYEIDRRRGFQRYISNPQRLVTEHLGVQETNGGVELAPTHPAVVYRYPSRNDDARTVIAASLPASGELYSTGYVHGLAHREGSGVEEILALLGYVNSYVCDWWARRFVDRHVTAPVVNNLPLPSWNDEQIKGVAELVAELLVRRGTNEIPGGIELLSSPTLATRDDEELLVEIEKLVCAGFGLSRADMQIVLADFSKKGCLPSLRKMLLGAIE